MVKTLGKDLWTRAAEVQVGAGEITATVTAEEGEYLFLNFVASKGYTVTVNGKKAELIDNDLHFLSVALEEGENVVKFSYSSPYIKYFAAGIAAAVVALLAVALIVKKTKFMQPYGCRISVPTRVRKWYSFIIPHRKEGWRSPIRSLQLMEKRKNFCQEKKNC